MAAIPLSQSVFERFSACTPDILEEEISRSSIRLRLQDSPGPGAQQSAYQTELDRLNGLKYLSQLRKGALSQQDFNLKVELVSR